MIKKMLAAALALGVSATAAMAADKIKIGVITTLTTPAAVLGNEQMNGFNLALKHLGNKVGGLPVELVVEDDGFKPEIGKQKADKLVKQDNVDVVTGLIWSHVMLASAQVGSGRRQVPDQRQRRALEDGRQELPSRTSSTRPGRTTRCRWPWVRSSTRKA